MTIAPDFTIGQEAGRSPAGSGHSPKGGAASASPAKPSVPNAAHTAGPWEWHQCFDPTGKHLTSLDICPRDGHSLSGVAVVASVWGGQEANARLIAAAPELYGAMESVRSFLMSAPMESGYCCCGSPVEGHGIGDGHSPVDELTYATMNQVELIDAALTKARGEQP